MSFQNVWQVVDCFKYTWSDAVLLRDLYKALQSYKDDFHLESVCLVLETEDDANAVFETMHVEDMLI